MLAVKGFFLEAIEYALVTSLDIPMFTHPWYIEELTFHQGVKIVTSCQDLRLYNLKQIVMLAHVVFMLAYVVFKFMRDILYYLIECPR